jgi:hypothetical protein
MARMGRMTGGGGSNGGIMGSGIFGFFGTTIRCDATNNSIYCTIMKFFNLFIVLLVVFFIFYFAYTYFKLSRGKRGGR